MSKPNNNNNLRYLTPMRVYNDSGEIKGGARVHIDLALVIGHEEFYDDNLKVTRPYTVLHLDTQYFLDAFMMIDIDFDTFTAMFRKYKDVEESGERYLFNRN